MNITNTLLFIIVILLGGLIIQRTFIFFKNKHINMGVQMGVSQLAKQIMKTAKEEKKFLLKDNQDSIELRMVKK